MADVFYGIDRNEKSVTKDTSTTGKEVEVVFDTALTPKLQKKDVFKALRRIEEAVLEDTAHNEI